MRPLHILQSDSGADRRWLKRAAQKNFVHRSWIAPKSVAIGDDAVIYVAGERFFAVGRIASESHPRPDRPGLSLPKTRFVRTGDVIRPGLDVPRCLQSARPGACSAHPFRVKRECVIHYNRWRISQESAEGALH